ncbi:uncharacterized protein PV07_09549 [Cladophialophora immunda]|uniref:Apple domain-containing protein n=1 Tax=Cladophialophora immunda TaxID=569365 RepID=A0A0D1ZF81_9EURO|nr:uncharacterized protein PV07_09549 [Cladophialophora immunda]KIW26456.1 hypothetical protein PV07_09549 [Cladophialophora immunda]OQV01125.1 hypothetical protein CLAIMM_06532 [Cladophialophora immunda]
MTTSTSTSSTSSAAVSLAAAPTSDCVNGEQYQADEYCGCTYTTLCSTHPTYPDDTLLLGIYGLALVTDNRVEYCADKCDVDSLCVSAFVNVEEQLCYLYNELPTGGVDDANYDSVQRVNNGADSCVNDTNGICLANIPV